MLDWAASVPPELWMEIFSSITCRQTVQHLTLTCKLFYNLAQPLLFSESAVFINCSALRYVNSELVFSPFEQCSLSETSMDRTLEQLSFLGQERIIHAITRCSLKPHPDILKIDAFESYTSKILDVFFANIFPRLSKLRHIKIDNLVLEASHITALAVPMVPSYSLQLRECSLGESAKVCNDRVLPLRELAVEGDISGAFLQNAYVPVPDRTALQSVKCESSDVQETVVSQLSLAGTLHSLTKLTLRCRSSKIDYDWRPFLMLHCPALEELHMNLDEPFPPSSPFILPRLRVFVGNGPAIRTYLANPHQRLTHLVFHGSFAQEQPVPYFQSASSACAELEILDCESHAFGLTHEDVAALCVLCPKLRNCSFMLHRQFPSSMDLVEMLAKIRYPRGLQSLVFSTASTAAYDEPLPAVLCSHTLSSLREKLRITNPQLTNVTFEDYGDKQFAVERLNGAMSSDT